MRLDVHALALVALGIGSPGCKAGDAGPDLPAPEETVATAPEASASVHYYGPRPPPAEREPHGVAPSPQHLWAPGFHRWDGRAHVWHPGGWYARREGLDYVAPHWENVYGRWEYIPGRWFRI